MYVCMYIYISYIHIALNCIHVFATYCTMIFTEVYNIFQTSTVLNHCMGNLLRGFLDLPWSTPTSAETYPTSSAFLVL